MIRFFVFIVMAATVASASAQDTNDHAELIDALAKSKVYSDNSVTMSPDSSNILLMVGQVLRDHRFIAAAGELIHDDDDSLAIQAIEDYCRRCQKEHRHPVMAGQSYRSFSTVGKSRWGRVPSGNLPEWDEHDQGRR